MKMSTSDPVIIMRYLPKILEGHNIFDKVHETPAETLEFIESTVRVSTGGVSQSDQIGRVNGLNDVNVTFWTKGTIPGDSVPYISKSGTQYHYIRFVGLFLRSDGLKKPAALLTLQVIGNPDMQMPLHKMKTCTVLMELQSNGATKEVYLDFSPGRWVDPENSESEQMSQANVNWFHYVELDKLSPLPWAKYDKNWTTKSGCSHHKCSIEIKWIKEKAGILRSMLDTKEYTDFKIKCSDNEDVECHRSVLAVASDALKQLLVYKSPKEGLDFGKLFEADSKTTMAFLRCIYSDYEDLEALDASFGVTLTVLRIAVEYNIPQLVEKSVGIIMVAEDMSWFDIPTLFELYGFVRLLTDSIEVMVELKEKVVRDLVRLLEENVKESNPELGGAEDENVGLRYMMQTSREVFKAFVKDALEYGLQL